MWGSQSLKAAKGPAQSRSVRCKLTSPVPALLILALYTKRQCSSATMNSVPGN